MLEEYNDEEFMGFVEANCTLQKICEDVESAKILKEIVKEVRKVLKSTGILDLREYNVDEKGESIRIHKEHVKIIHDKLNMI